MADAALGQAGGRRLTDLPDILAGDSRRGSADSNGRRRLWRTLVSGLIASAPGLFISLALAATIPVLLFGGWVAYLTADQQRASTRRAAEETVSRVARRLEAELLQEVDVAETLALSEALETPDLARFYEEAKRVTAARPLWETVTVADRSGQQILNVLRPFGDRLDEVADHASFEKVLRSLKPVIGGIGPPGSLSAERLVALRVPVLREGELRYVLTIGLAPDQIGASLRQAGAPDGWIGSVIDGRGKVVAQTTDEGAAAGTTASAAVRQAIQYAPAGFYRGETADGVPVETAYRPLGTIEGWSVHFTIPSAELDGPVRRSMALLVSGALGSVGLAIALGLIVAREIAQRRRRDAVELDASERRGALSVEAAELGTWRWDLEKGEITGSDRFRRLLDLPERGGGVSAWTATEVLGHVNPIDRGPLEQSARACLARSLSMAVDFRAVREHGDHWLRAAGNVEPRLGRSSGVIYGVLADIQAQKQAETERTELLRRIALAHEAEQRRIARELHDQVGQTVTGLALGLKRLEQNLEAADLAAARDKVKWLRTIAGDIGRDIHRTASDLRSAALEDVGLYEALTSFLAEWSERYGISTDLQVVGGERRPPAEIELVLYRVVQEALNNVLKHARATNVSVILERCEQSMRLVVEDDGVGFDPAPETVRLQPGRSGLGLSGMRERLAMVRGSVAIESSPGSGTAIFVQLPLGSEA